jgi:hypothetical protein
MNKPTNIRKTAKDFGVKPKGKYFTEEDVKNFKDGSIPYPLIVYEGEDLLDVVEVNEVVSLRGMADNNGTPNVITILKHVKGKPTERLEYTLTERFVNRK